MKYTDAGTNADDHISYSTDDGTTYIEVNYVVVTPSSDIIEGLSSWGFDHEKSIEEKMIEWRAKMASFERYPRNLFKRYTGSNYKQTRRKHIYRRYIPN